MKIWKLWRAVSSTLNLAQRTIYRQHWLGPVRLMALKLLWSAIHRFDTWWINAMPEAEFHAEWVRMSAQATLEGNP